MLYGIEVVSLYLRDAKTRGIWITDWREEAPIAQCEQRSCRYEHPDKNGPDIGYENLLGPQ